MIRSCTAACAVILLLACSQAQAILGYTDKLPPEPAAAREARHKRVAERRAGTALIVHRGMSSVAHENTLQAYNAAMDYGADGCEVDIRRTADGVLVLFHDDMLDNLTNGFGDVSQLTYAELLSLKLRPIDGVDYPGTRIPTFAALLQLARKRAMLLHLDIKRPETGDDIVRMLDEADMWDHIVCAPLEHPKFQPMNYKGGLLEEGWYNDPDAAKAKLAQYGNMAIVEDPRVVAHVLGRPGYTRVPLPEGLTCEIEQSVAPPTDGDLIPQKYIAELARKVDSNSCRELLALLDSRRMERIQPDGSAEYERGRTERILARAWAARRLGELGCASEDVVRALEFQVANRSIHRDWRYHGLDGSMAALALAELGSVRSVTLLIDCLTRDAPELGRIVPPGENTRPPASYDGLYRAYLFEALSDLQCPESKAFLEKGIETSDEKVAKMGSGWQALFAKAQLRYELPSSELEKLLTHRNRAVQATAVQYCLDHVTSATDAALKSVAPWALELPRGVR